jgi:hypothetical protein
MADCGIHNIGHRVWIEFHGLTVQELTSPQMIIRRVEFLPLIEIIENECKHEVD